MPRILLVGAFGQRNVGDEALCRALCTSLADHRVTIVSRDPEESARLHGCPSIASGAASVVRALRTTDVVVVGGGTIFKSLHRSSRRRPSALLVNTVGLVELARAWRIPVAFVGVGAGELNGDLARLLTRRIVPRADLLVLRDEESAAVLTDAGLRPPFWIGADPAWQLFEGPAIPRPSPATGRRRVTVALSHLADAGRDGSTVVEHLGVALAELAADDWDVVLQPWQIGAPDRAVADALRRHVPTATTVQVPRDLVAAARHFADDDLVIAMRFHALVAAGAAATRTVTLAHEPKLAGLARRLDQVAVPADASAPVLATAIEWAIDHDAPQADAVQRQIELADHTIRLMRLLVDGGELEHPEEFRALQLSDGDGRW